MSEKGRKNVSNPTSTIDRIESNVVKGGAGSGELEWVDDENHLEVHPGAVEVEDCLDAVGHLAANSVGPSLARDAQPRQTLNDDPVLVVPVLDPVVELGIDSDLARDLLMQANVSALKV